MSRATIAERTKRILPDTDRALATLNAKPITPSGHAMLDLFNAALLGIAPTAFELRGTTPQLVRAYATIETVVNALSDTPLAAKRVIPFRTHRLIDKWAGLAFLAAALATDGLRNRRNLAFVAGQALLGFAVYNLTDWDADSDS